MAEGGLIADKTIKFKVPSHDNTVQDVPILP